MRFKGAILTGLIFLISLTLSGCSGKPALADSLSDSNDGIIKSIGTFSSKRVPDREDKLVITYSPKVELLLTVAALADDPKNPRYNQADKGNIIGSAAREYFKDFSSHRAVKKLKFMKLRGFWYDGLTKFIMCYSDPPNMEKVFPYPESLPKRFFSLNAGKELDELAEALNVFYKDTKFDEFLAKHKPEYDKMLDRLNDETKGRDVVGRLEDYFGDERKGYFVVVSPFMTGGHAGDMEYNGDRYIFDVCGPGYDMTGSDIEELAYHEFGHSFVNIEAEKNKKLVDKYKSLQKDIKKDMTSQNYSDWKTALNEHILRAANARMMESLKGQGMRNVKFELSRGFEYIPALYERLNEYEENRTQYKRFSDFYPELLSSLDVYLSGNVPDELNINVGPVLADATQKDFIAVFGTMGTKDENDAARNRAEWITARYKDRGKKVNLLKDTEVTSDMFKNNDFLLYGGPSVNKVVREMQDKFPVKFDGKGFIYNGKSYADSSMGVDFAMKNPYNRDKYIAVYAGNSAESQLKCHSIMNGPTSIVIFKDTEILVDDFL